VRVAVLTVSAAVAVAVAGTSWANRASTLDLADFAYSVTLPTAPHKAALCVARSGEARQGWRLTGLGYQKGMDWAPDGSRFAVSLERPSIGPIRVAPADSSHGFRPVTFPRAKTEADSLPRWSPDDARIAFARYVFYGPRVDYRRAGLWVVELSSRRERQLSRRFPDALAWSPSGNRLAVRFDGDLSLFKAGGGVEWTISRGSESRGGVAWSPSGDVLAAGFEREVLLIAPDRRVLRTIVRPHSTVLELEGGMSWSPDGGRLALGGGVIYDRGGSLVGRFAPPSTMDAVASSPAFTSDGTAVVFERARVVTVGSRYTPTRALGNADLFVAPGRGGRARPLTATPQVDEGAVNFRPARTGGTAGSAQPCVLAGTAGRDVLYGTPAEDLVVAGPGNDAVYGHGGSDLITGGDGNDVLRGGPGHDEIRGDAGGDRLHAVDKERDRVMGGPGRDRAWIDRRGDSYGGVERLYRR
jgi:RTX calcium-binding nonapeptide repeat (4 copies)/WD40-like Beta Propeller Repeat